MKTLRDGTIKEVLRHLDQGMLSRHHFDTTFNQGDGTLVSIVFRDAPQYFFRILQPESTQNNTTQWRTLESPGRYFTTEEPYEYREFSQSFGQIGSWVARLVEDLAVSTTDTSWVAELRANLEHAADALPNPEEPFSDSEVEAWSEKFAALVERLQKLEDENQLRKGQVEELKRQLANIKAQGSTVPRRTWLKAAGHKILDVFEHGAKAGIKAVAEGAVRVMLEHIKG